MKKEDMKTNNADIEGVDDKRDNAADTSSEEEETLERTNGQESNNIMEIKKTTEHPADALITLEGYERLSPEDWETLKLNY